MPLTPAAPVPNPKLAKAIFKALEWALPIAYAALVDYNGHTTAVHDLEWRRLAVEISRTTPGGTVEDRAVTTWDLLNITGGDIDTSWTTTDYTTAEAAFDEFWGTWAGLASSSHAVVGYKWYAMRFADPMTASHRFENTGPPQRAVSKAIPGTGSSAPLPYQIACAITEKTAIPRHWGRVYIPGIATVSMGTQGRWGSGFTTFFANAAAELVDDLGTAQLFPVVATTQMKADGSPPGTLTLKPGLNQITSLVVDDIPDVIRSRRPKQPLLRTIGTPTP